MSLETATHLANIAEENHTANSDDSHNEIVAEIFDGIVDQIDADPSISPQDLLEIEQVAEVAIEEVTE